MLGLITTLKAHILTEMHFGVRVFGMLFNIEIRNKTTKKFKKKDAENSRDYRKTYSAEINKRDRARKKEKREWVDSLKKKMRTGDLRKNG